MLGGTDHLTALDSNKHQDLKHVVFGKVNCVIRGQKHTTVPCWLSVTCMMGEAKEECLKCVKF